MPATTAADSALASRPTSYPVIGHAALRDPRQQTRWIGLDRGLSPVRHRPARHEVRSDRLGLARDRSRPSRRSVGQRDKSAALRPSDYLRRDYLVFALPVSLRDTIYRAAFAVFRELHADSCILSRRELRGLLRIGDSTGNGYLPAGRGTGQALYPRNGGSLARYTARIERRRLSSRVKASCKAIARETVERHRCAVSGRASTPSSIAHRPISIRSEAVTWALESVSPSITRTDSAKAGRAASKREAARTGGFG